MKDADCCASRRWQYKIGGLLVVTVLTALIGRGFRVDGNSMEPGLHDGNYVIGIKPFVYKLLDGDIEKGDIIVFRRGQSGSIIKRVAAVPGDTISVIKDSLRINGRSITAAIPSAPQAWTRWSHGAPGDWHLSLKVNRSSKPYVPSSVEWGPIAIPQDSLFVLGDNVSRSRDSKTWGPVSNNGVMCVVVVTL